MKVSARKFMLAALVSAFAGQTALVYSDSTADEFGALSALELAGREIWHEHNCQVCHQVYGFGGFLGPDLTNAAARINRARLDTILTEGYAQMPAFHMSPEQIDAVEAFLGALDRTGVGQARVWREVASSEVVGMIDQHRGENPMTEAAARGFESFRTRCISCHTPFRATPLGPFLAADLSTVVRRLDREAIDATLVAGRIEKGMPPTGCDEQQRAELIEFFGWLADEEPVLRPRCDAARVQLDVPWYDFK